MSTEAVSVPTAKTKVMFCAGWVLSVLLSLAMIMSAVMKLMKPPEVLEGLAKSGWPESLLVSLGVLELVCVLVYLVPQTAVLGAILLTGYMGGAIATHLRLEEPIYLQSLFGILFWLGIYLRDARVRALIPWRTTN